MKKLIALFLTAALAFTACDDNTTNPPTVITPLRISSPSSGSTLRDKQVIHAVAGEGYSYTRIDFLVDGDSIFSDASAPYDYQWNIFEYESGSSHSLQVRGFTADTTYLSSTVSVQLSFTSGFSLVSTYSSLSQQANGVINYGDAIFVSNGVNGLELIDISSISSPVFRSRYSTSGYALHADIEYPYVYIADRDQKVLQADFSDPDTILPLFTYTSQSQVSDVAVSANYLFVAETDGLSILRLFNLNPYSRQSFSDHLNYVVARHDTAFIVGNSSFFIVDCTNPNSSEIIGSYDNLSLAQGAAVIDTFAFVASSGAGLVALSIANPENPRELARYNPGQSIVTVDVGDGILFAGASTGQVYALDYHIAGTISLLHLFNDGNQIKEIDYKDNYLFVAATSNVDILRFIR